jgi:hypothetical protein
MVAVTSNSTPVSFPRSFIGRKPLCASSEPAGGAMENGRPSSFIARVTAALLGKAPRKKTWVSIDMTRKHYSRRASIARLCRRQPYG